MWIVYALSLIGMSPSGVSVDAAENQNGKRPSREQVRGKSERDDRLQKPSRIRDMGASQGNRQKVRDRGNRQKVRDQGNRQKVRDQGNRQKVRDQGNRQKVRDRGNRQDARDQGNRRLAARESDRPLEEQESMGPRGMGPRGSNTRGMNRIDWPDAPKDPETQGRPRRGETASDEGSRGRGTPELRGQRDRDERRSGNGPQRGRCDEGEE